MPINPLACPWGGFAPPTTLFCEELLCSWVTTPANTWSNIAFLLAGAALWRQEPPRSGTAAGLFGPIALAIGVFSGLYHASSIFALQVLDNAAMFLFACLLLCLNLRRLGALSSGAVLPLYLGLVGASIALMFVFPALGLPTQAIFAAQIFAVLGTELRLLRSGGVETDYAFLVGAAAVFTASFALWILDQRRILCDPSNHIIQGHAVWHVGCAVCLILLQRFYRQFQL